MPTSHFYYEPALGLIRLILDVAFATLDGGILVSQIAETAFED